jgi:hypothetical protein
VRTGRFVVVALIQIAEISRDSLDLRFSQAVRNRFHDGGGVRIGRILAPLLAPIHQFPQDVVVELTCQTRKRSVAFGLRTVARRAWGNVGARNALLIDFFPCGDEFPRRAPEGLGIEIFDL